MESHIPIRYLSSVEAITFGVIFQEFLSVESCVRHVICRGLIRVRCILELTRIIEFLTVRGYINTGLLRNVPRKGLLPHCYNQVGCITCGNTHF